MSDGKILIMGVGGCGSSFLWNLLGSCGLKTLGINEWMRHSGIRSALKNGTAHEWEYPKVIKHLGGFINNLNQHIDENNWEVEHIFFAVASLEYQMKQYVKRRTVAGKRKDKSKEEIYEEALTDYHYALGKGLIQLIERDHSFTLVRCPRSIKDSEYCYNQLKVVLGDMTYKEFKWIHDSEIIPKYYSRIKDYD
jgi:hypothetical protein